MRADNHERPLLIRYVNNGADGLMVPMVDTADHARAIVEAVRYGCYSDHETRLVVAMIETTHAVANLDDLLAVEGIAVFFVGPGDMSQSLGFPPAVPLGQTRGPPSIGPSGRLGLCGLLPPARSAMRRIGRSGQSAGTGTDAKRSTG